ncbi:unnamed protein product, partial [Prunus brigantina]
KIITSSRFQVRYLQNLLGASSKLRKHKLSTSSKNFLTSLSLYVFLSL